jgi:amino acid transporter
MSGRGSDGATTRTTRIIGMASGKQQQQRETELHGGVLSGDGSPGLWGALIGLIVFVFLAVPISISVRFATHPATKELFGGRLEEASNGAYAAFWWVIAIGLFAIPFLIGWAVAKRSGKTLSIIIGIVALFFVAILVLGQLF